MRKVIHVSYRDHHVRKFDIPVELKALAAIYGITMKHVQERNPGLTQDQAERVALRLIPEVLYRLYRGS